MKLKTIKYKNWAVEKTKQKNLRDKKMSDKEKNYKKQKLKSTAKVHIYNFPFSSFHSSIITLQLIFFKNT